MVTKPPCMCLSECFTMAGVQFHDLVLSLLSLGESLVFFFLILRKLDFILQMIFLNLNILRQEIYLNEKNNSDDPLIIGC